MPFVIPVAAAIGAAVASAATAVAAVVATAATVIASAAAAAAAWVWSGITAAYAFVAEAVADISFGWSVAGEVYAGTTSLAGTSLFTQVAAYAHVLVLSFGGFLEAIHFTTLLTIHEIAYIVSDDYRAMWSKVYSEFGEISYALGYSADFLNIIIRDSRNVVLDAAAMMGQSYDLAEVTWIKSFQGYLKIFSDQASKYTKNPAAVFYDIDRMLTKPAVDNKAGIMQMTFQTIDSAIKFVRTGIEQTDKLRVDLGKLISDLPHQIRDEIKPWFDKVTKDFADWIQTEYRPSLKAIDGIINVLERRQEVQHKNTSDLVNRLRHPGDYLKEIDTFSENERRRQEREVSEIAFRASAEESAKWRSAAEEQAVELQETGRRLRAPSERPSWEIYEVETPERPAGAPVEPRETWFVGDF